MQTPREALRAILGRVRRLEETQRVPISKAVGRVLSDDVVSDIDLPPFEKSAMDGYAVHAVDLGPERAPEGERSLPILGESRAGEPFQGSVPEGACVAIYTGAEVPDGCDAVVMVEQSEREGDDAEPRVRLRDAPRPMQNICNRGQDLAVGGVVQRAGRRLTPSDLAVLAAVGCEPVPVVRRPRVSILTSGDELVAVTERPGPGQIREGNTLHLAAMSSAAGAEVVRVAIVPDDEAALEAAFRGALEDSDALITTGGVSMGKYDLVGATLERIGVEGVFHRVAIKPGKPLWFGVLGQKPVFALPGNPVSCLVNHEVFVAPSLRRMGGERDEDVDGRPLRARWRGRPPRENVREQYLPVRCESDADGVLWVEPVQWNGSADVVGLARAEALAVVPPETAVAEGDVVVVRPLERGAAPGQGSGESA